MSIFVHVHRKQFSQRKKNKHIPQALLNKKFKVLFSILNLLSIQFYIIKIQKGHLRVHILIVERNELYKSDSKSPTKPEKYE